MTYYRKNQIDLRNRKLRKIATAIIEWVLFALCFLVVPGIAGFAETHYSHTAIVSEVDGDEILIEDSTGNLWEYEGEGYKVGDKLKVTFYTNLTDNTKRDDIITKIKRM